MRQKLQKQQIHEQIMSWAYCGLQSYQVLISSLLLIFVPQNCNNVECTYYQNLTSFNTPFHIFGIFINFLCLLSFIILYYIENRRETQLILFMNENKAISFENYDIEKRMLLLPIKEKDYIYTLDKYYDIIGYVSFIIYIINVIISGVLISNYSYGSGTILMFITNSLFICEKMYKIYYVIHTDKSIFYSAYLTEFVQYNDLLST